MKTAVILPVYNEAGCLRSVLYNLRDALCPLQQYDIQVVAVDDGSNDGSGDIIKQMAAEWDALRLIRCAHHRGYGSAIRTGLAAVKYCDAVAIMDSDGQFDAGDLAKLFSLLPDADIAAGVRHPRADSVLRRMLGRCGSRLARTLYRTRLKDLNCGMKVFRREVIESLSLKSSGGAIYLEIFCQPSIRGFRIAELPVQHHPRLTGRASGCRINTLLGIWRDSLPLLVNSSG